MALAAGAAMAFAPLAVATAPPAAAEHDVFNNDVGISIPDVGATFQGLNVSGMDGDIFNVVLVLKKLTHPRPADLDFYLQSPAGTLVQLVGDSGGSHPIVNQTITLKQGFPLVPGNANPLSTGTYAPFNRNSNVGCTDHPDPVFLDGFFDGDFTAFDHEDPNGTWILYAIDDCAGPTGFANPLGGWTLRIHTKEASTFNWTAPATAKVGETFAVDDPANHTTNSDGVIEADVVEGQTDGVGASEACSIIPPATISFDHPGTCAVRARQLGSFDYYPSGYTGIQFIEVTKGDQIITFVDQGDVHIGDAGYVSQVKVNGDDWPGTPTPSGNDVVFSLGGGSDPGVCSVALDGAVTFHHAGNCQVLAQVSGDADYLSGAAVDNITVLKSTQSIQVNNEGAIPAEPTVGDTFQIDAESIDAAMNPTGLPIAYSVHPDTDPGACSVNATGLVSFDGVGDCVIALDQAGNDDYEAAAQVRFPAVGAIEIKKAQSINTSSFPLIGFDNMTVQLNASASGANTPLVYSSLTGAVCSVTPTGQVTYLNNGTCMIQVDKAGDANYWPTSTVASITVL